MTETFYFSVLGILALMIGALIINVMFNLTRIADSHHATASDNKKSKKVIYSLLALFPVITILLFTGDYLTSKKKENMLLQSAKSMIGNSPLKSGKLLNYHFKETYIIETSNILELFSKTDEHFTTVRVIVEDSIDSSPVFLGFDNYYDGNLTDTIYPAKKNFIITTTQPEREYLDEFFTGKTNKPRYSSYNGNYELFYPFVKGNKRIIVYFSDEQRYGKLGS